MKLECQLKSSDLQAEQFTPMNPDGTTVTFKGCALGAYCPVPNPLFDRKLGMEYPTKDTDEALEQAEDAVRLLCSRYEKDEEIYRY